MNTVAVVVGSLVAALLAYVFQVLGGRALGPEEFVPITVLWTVQFLAIQVLYQPVEHYVNRETRLGNPPGLLRILGLGVGAGVFAMVVTLPFVDRFLGGDLLYVGLAGLLVAAYAPFGWVRGRLAATEKFGLFGLVTAGDAGLRVVAAVSLMWAGALGFATAMVLAPLVSLMFIAGWSRGWSRGGEPAPLGWTIAPLISASAAAQALLGLAPLAAGAFGASAATVSVVFMTFAMYRGPIWVIQGVMARLMPLFVDKVRDSVHDSLTQWTRILAAGAGSLSVVAAAAGYFIAPPVFALLLGEGFRPDASFSALVATGVVLAAAGGMFNQILFALDQVGTISKIWLLSFVVAVMTAVALPTADPVLRIGVAFLVGEVMACARLYHGCMSNLATRGIHEHLSHRDLAVDLSDGAAPR